VGASEKKGQDDGLDQVGAYDVPKKTSLIEAIEATPPLSLDANEDHPHQARQIFEELNDSNSLEDAVKLLQLKAKPIQEELVSTCKAVGQKLTEGGFRVYDPKVKSFESALRKSSASYGGPGRIRQLTDIYRASIVVETREHINLFDPETIEFKAILDRKGFTVIQFTNTFDTPWADGYRDLNMRVRHERTGMVGELQIHLCSVKKYTEIMGHKFYEVIRTVSKGKIKSHLQSWFNHISSAGYEQAMRYEDRDCLEQLDELHRKDKADWWEWKNLTRVAEAASSTVAGVGRKIFDNKPFKPPK
jgi:hypothetical protein